MSKRTDRIRRIEAKRPRPVVVTERTDEDRSDRIVAYLASLLDELQSPRQG